MFLDLWWLFTSIIDSQNFQRKLSFHLAVVLSFNAKDMLKIYSLRNKIRDDVEFNFYNAKRVETELKDLNTKGPGAVAKLLLPELSFYLKLDKWLKNKYKK